MCTPVKFPIPDGVKLPPMPLDIRIQEHVVDRKLVYEESPILFIWMSDLGDNKTVELTWTWLQGKDKYRAYYQFLVPFVPMTKEYEKAVGAEGLVIDKLEITRVEDYGAYQKES